VFFPPSAATNTFLGVDSLTASIEQKMHTATVGVSYLFH
jgi:hypothetical protein